MSSSPRGEIMEFVDVIASEVSHAACVAVARWMAEVERALTDPHLTSLGRLNAACEVVARYKQFTGKVPLCSH
jgi:hypothetical protein